MSLSKKFMLIIPVLWLGFILSISFMEAWLKFQAVGVTREIGLSIGSLVFNTLNKVEILFSVMLTIIWLKTKKRKIKFSNWLLFVLIILAIQSIFLLPKLDYRIQLILNGNEPTASFLHFYYIALEVLKVVGLIMVTRINLKEVVFQKNRI